MAAKHHMLGQRWKEMTLQWKNPWYAPCSITEFLQKYALKRSYNFDEGVTGKRHFA